MTVRWYLWPVEETLVPPGRGPKYLKWRYSPDGEDVPWGWQRYGLMPTCLLWADVTLAQHTLFDSFVDTTSIPENIDQQIGTQNALDQVVAAMEALHIPAGWITVNHTYHEIMRKMCGLFQLAQRYQGKYVAKLIDTGYDLDTLIQDLPVTVRLHLSVAAEELGWDTSSILGTWTVRQALGYLADQWGNAPFLLAGLEL